MGGLQKKKVRFEDGSMSRLGYVNISTVSFSASRASSGLFSYNSRVCEEEINAYAITDLNLLVVESLFWWFCPCLFSTRGAQPPTTSLETKLARSCSWASQISGNVTMLLSSDMVWWKQIINCHYVLWYIHWEKLQLRCLSPLKKSQCFGLLKDMKSLRNTDFIESKALQE